MTSFELDIRTRVIAGPGRLNEIGSWGPKLGATRVLLVTDPGIRRLGYPERAAQALTAAGLAVEVFDGAVENPTTAQVRAGVALAREFGPDLLVGLGGGSSLDCAKGINFLFSCGGTMKDYWGVNRATGPLLPMIAVPTTAGTGSEMQSFALISDEETHVKMACGDKRAACAVAILDPELTLTQPPMVTALTGIDALSHALETYVCRRRNPVSMLYSREAWRLLATNFLRVWSEPDNLTARGAMQLGAAWAGVAIEHSMLGAAHSLANPLTARHGTVHGQAVAVGLPHVIRFNGEVHDDWYRELLLATSDSGITPPPETGARGVADFFNSLVESCGLHSRLADFGVTREELPGLATEAAQQWTAQFNPRQVSREDLLALYEQAF